MAQELRLRNKMLSMRGSILVTSTDGSEYSIIGRSFFWPSYSIHRNGQQVGAVSRKLFALMPAWRLDSDELGSFSARRRLGFRRRYSVLGGPYDGATIQGSVLDLNFKIELGGRTLATGRGQILSLTDVHDVTVHSDEPRDILFCLLAMAMVQSDRRTESATRNHD